MKKLVTFFTAVMALLSTGQAISSVYYDYAHVLEVHPVYDIVTVREPVRHCYNERVRHHGNGGTLLGTVVGGALGGVITDSGAGAVAGAIIGGAIGHDSDHRRARYHRSRVCEVSYDQVRQVEELSGYRVKYRYRGKTYRTTLRNHPGERIKVRVRVDPAY